MTWARSSARTTPPPCHHTAPMTVPSIFSPAPVLPTASFIPSPLLNVWPWRNTSGRPSRPVSFAPLLHLRAQDSFSWRKRTAHFAPALTTGAWTTLLSRTATRFNTVCRAGPTAGPTAQCNEGRAVGCRAVPWGWASPQQEGGWRLPPKAAPSPALQRGARAALPRQHLIRLGPGVRPLRLPGHAGCWRWTKAGVR